MAQWRWLYVKPHHRGSRYRRRPRGTALLRGIERRCEVSARRGR
jgi:hypothetical protein